LFPRHCVIASWSSDEPPKELLEAKNAQQLEAVPGLGGLGRGLGMGLGGLGEGKNAGKWMKVDE